MTSSTEIEKKEHAHRFTLSRGTQVISSIDSGDPHVHTVRGVATSSDPAGENHSHTVELDGVVVESGPPIHPETPRVLNEAVSKGMMPDLIDPNHTYVFKTGEYGIYDYWYIDQQGNYWKYTNAPEEHKDFDPHAGVPLLVRSQPMPSTAPGFFTPEGRKRHVAVPQEIVPERNPEYNPLLPENIWYEVYQSQGQTRYVYLDSDVRENLDLWVQYQLRVTDASLSRLRQFAVDRFSQNHPKDRILGVIIMLMDQGLYELDDLVEATVADIEFVDQNVKLLGRKFLCDPDLLDFLTSLVGDRDKSAPLFQIDTVHGTNAFGKNHLYSIFHYLKVSPTYLLAWHASHMFSRIMSRLAFEEVPNDEVEGRAFSELQRIFVTKQDVRYLVDYKVRHTTVDNYKKKEPEEGAEEEEPEEGAEEPEVEKSLNLMRDTTDSYGTLLVLSDLTGRKPDEVEFSEWLHSEPMHLVTPVDELAVQKLLEEAEEAEEDTPAAPEEAGSVDAGGADVGETDTEAP